MLTSLRRALPGLLAMSFVACTLDRGASDTSQVRREIEVQYERIADAISRRDLAAILATQDSAFTSLNPNGQVFDYAAMAEYSQRLVGTVDTVLHISNRIRTLDVRGAAQDTAVADVCQEFTRLQRMGGAQRLVETSALQTETWVRRGTGWRRSRVENVRGTRWFVDGKRVDSSRPYDPNAPPFSPAVDPPTQCGRR